MLATDAEFKAIVRAELQHASESITANICIGITGSRGFPTGAQQDTLSMLIGKLAESGPCEMHHGCCIGTDECAHFIGAKIPDMLLIGHPGYGINHKSPYQMTGGHNLFAVILPALPYKQRNLAIVRASNILLACPLFPENDSRSARSGTWQTVRMARQANEPVILIPPAGIPVIE
jgi:hypothetical protein